MKIRIKGNSLRYRLTRSEVEHFATEGVCKEVTNFGDDHLTYVLQRTAEYDVFATFKNNIITLFIPEALADEWTSTDRVGIEADNGPMHLLLEKDFMCTDATTEDQSDNYPNPLAR
ncbi:DUF7009 family protein [Mucilaginibacter sp. KACC 22063]|uniref:DUF7009 family protein n=1 Tax=Mucilaginibacter sp. KACC 22063 TaxID=3025666 RepID=UPI002365951B|nr:hypothetical protein [Mucilaginibacter sp. KACC 22063]WDF53425.1 hypothetical protein PQ461_10750 [Mucilaginibacter sp. KACC 22063]